MINSDLIKKQKELPKKTGVYMFLNKKEVPIYIGKAKNLKVRTSYYFKFEQLSKRFKKMISEALFLKFYVTETESEAFLLEAQLIKEKQPKYNIQFKSGRSLYYINFSDHEFPKLEIKSSWSKKSIGPFLSYHNLKVLTNELLKIFKLRTCSDFIFKSRKRPCLEYYSKRCTAPCVNLITQEEYKKSFQKMNLLFQGQNLEVIKRLKKELKIEVKEENFEEAGKIRDNIELIQKLNEKQGIFFENIKALDIVLFFKNYFYSESIRNGAIVNIEYRKYEKKVEKQDILSEYFYDNIKNKIIGYNEISFNNYTCKVTAQEKNILEYANKRFKNLLLEDQVKDEWKESLNIEKLNTFEVYDCSHYNGKFAVCGMIYANIQGEFFKNKYKVWKFEKKTFNDLEILEECLKKRAKKGAYPDIVIIDGGKTQLNIAKKVLQFENIFAFTKDINRKSGVLYNSSGTEVNISEPLKMFLENLRSEAHNWAKRSSSSSYTKSFVDLT